MFDVSVLVIVLAAVAFMGRGLRKAAQQINRSEQDVLQLAAVMSQLTEMEADSHRKLSARFEELEERIMELSVPSHHSGLPLERRHQVIALARQGVGLDEIVERLKAPVGEAELIMNLHKCAGGEAGSTAASRQVRRYA